MNLSAESEPSIARDAFTLQSKAIEPGTSVFGDLAPVTLLVVAGLLATLVIANAIAEANSDSFLGGIKRQFGSDRTEHLFLPVVISSPQHQNTNGYLVRLNKHRASFFSPHAFGQGTKITFRLNVDSNQKKEQPWFHGTVTKSHDEAPNTFEIETRIHAKSESERADLASWILSLEPSIGAT